MSISIVIVDAPCKFGYPPSAPPTPAGISLVLGALGELSEDDADPLEAALRPLLASASSAVRQAAAATLGAICTAVPPSAARMLGSAMSGLEAAAQQLLAEGSSAASVVAVMTPAAGGTAGHAVEPARIAALHGSALAVSSLLMAASRCVMRGAFP